MKVTAEHNLVSDIKRDIPKFDTVLLHSNWSNLWRKYLSKIPTDKRVECWAKSIKISGISDATFPARHPQNSLQHVLACAAGDGAICSKNRKIVPYHGANPNTRNGACLRSPSPIMAPGNFPFVTCIFLVCTLAKNETPVFIGLISAALSCLIYVTSGSSPSSGWQSSVVCIPRKHQWLPRYTILIKTGSLIMQFESFIGLEIVGYEPLKHTRDFFNFS